MASRNPNQSEEVDRFVQNLKHPLEAVIERVRAIILNSDERITEHIKWNAPSFCFNGDDRITFRLHPNDRLQLVFHRGAKAKEDKEFKFEDRSGLLKWASSDRAVLTLQDIGDVEAKRTELEEIVQRWIKSTTG